MAVLLASSLLHATAQTPLVSLGAVWKHLADGSDQGTDWRQAGFADAAWPGGPAELGFDQCHGHAQSPPDGFMAFLLDGAETIPWPFHFGEPEA